MKKRPRLALCLVLVWLAAACGGSPSRPSVTVTYACYPGEAAECSHLEPLARAFMEEHPEVTVKLVPYDEVFGGGPRPMSPQDMTRLASAVDAFRFYSDAISHPQTPEGVVLPLEPLLAEEDAQVLADFPEAALALFRRDGKLYGLPRDTNPLLIYYDPVAFDQAGLPHPHIGWTWDEFLQAAVALTEREGGQVTRYGFADPLPARTLTALARQRVDTLLDLERQPPELYLDGHGVGEAIAWYAGLSTTHRVMPANADVEARAAAQAAIEAGDCAMWVGQAIDWRTYHQGRGALIAPLPENGRAGGAMFATGYFISAGTAHPGAAWRWIEYLSRQEPESGASSIVPPRASAHWQRWEALDLDTQQVLEYAVSHSESYGVVEAALSRAYRSYLAGTPLAEVLEGAQSTGEMLLAEEAIQIRTPSTPVPVATVPVRPTSDTGAVRFMLVSRSELGLYSALASRFAADNPGAFVEIIVPDAATGTDKPAHSDCFLDQTTRLVVLGTGGLLSLDALVDAGDLDPGGFAPGAVAAQVEGVTWAIPVGVDVQLLYYNVDLFDGAGLAYPSNDWDVDDFVRSAMVLSRGSGDGPTYGFYPRDGAYRHVAGYLAWFGGTLFDGGGAPTFTDPSVVGALSQYADLVQEAMPAGALEEARYFGLNTILLGVHPGPVAGGRVAMWLDSYHNHVSSPALGFDVGVAAPPQGSSPMEGFASRSFFISAQTDKRDACWRWLSFLVMQPEATTMLPASLAVVESDVWREGVGEETAAAWQAVLARGMGTAPADAGASLAAYWLGEALHEVLQGRDVTEALEYAQEAAAAFLACYDQSDGSREATEVCAVEADPQVLLRE